MTRVTARLSGALIALGCWSGTLQAQEQPLRDSLRGYYLPLIKSDKPEDQQKLETELDRLSHATTEQQLNMAVSIYSMTKRQETADSLSAEVVKKFPKGKLALMAGYMPIIQGDKNADETIDLYDKWVGEFPEPDSNASMLYDYSRSQIVSTLMKEKRVKEAIGWLINIKSVPYSAMIETSAGQTLAGYGDTVTALSLLRDAVHKNEVSWPGNPDPYAKNNYLNSIEALSSLLSQAGEATEALKYATLLYQEGDKENTGIKQAYAMALYANGQYDEAFPLIEALMSKGQASRQTRGVFKEVYTKVKGGATGFDDYLQQLQQTMREEIKAKVAGNMLDAKAPAFTIKDIEGKTVSLAALKGKVVVLDFWATWCGPCKRSFPAMQQAVDRYAKDENVQFLFIDTWERMDDPVPAIKELMAANGYRFHILLDDKTTGVVGKFGVKGIPAKFVIDGNGFIRFKLTGFDGAEEAAVEELSAMIELARSKS